jgi:26S proteasome non-ATPase regulatory subunit 10
MSIDQSDIQRAVMDGNVGIVKSLLADDPKLALTRDGDSRTPLHWATSCQNLEMVKILLDPSKYAKDQSGEKIIVDLDDYTDDSNWTPLHIAASAGDLEIFKLLATHEPIADINAQTSTGQTCLHYAVSKNHFFIVSYLLTDLKASARIKDKKNQLPLHRAAAIGSEKLVRYLVEIGKSPVNTVDSFGMSPLHHALAEGHADVALLLVKYGADWKQNTSDGHTVYDVALNDKIRIFFKKGLIAEGILEEEDN